MNECIFDLNDIPDDFELTNIQKNQVMAHKRQKPTIDTETIKKELDALKFPLYFFDYEAFDLRYQHSTDTGHTNTYHFNFLFIYCEALMLL